MDDVFHMMRLAVDQATQVQNNTLSLIALANNSSICMLKCGKFFLVAFAFALKFFRNLLLKHKSLKSIITLLLGTGKAHSKPSRIVLLLVNESCKTAVLTLVILNLNLEFLSLFRKLLRKCLEFKELIHVSTKLTTD